MHTALWVNEIVESGRESHDNSKSGSQVKDHGLSNPW